MMNAMLDNSEEEAAVAAPKHNQPIQVIQPQKLKLARSWAWKYMDVCQLNENIIAKCTLCEKSWPPVKAEKEKSLSSSNYIKHLRKYHRDDLSSEERNDKKDGEKGLQNSSLARMKQMKIDLAANNSTPRDFNSLVERL